MDRTSDSADHFCKRTGKESDSAETAANLCWLVAALYLFSAVCQFIGIAVIYNIDKKTLEKMTADLEARKAEAVAVEAPAEAD